MARFLNHYRCPRCEEVWTDAWSCICDDRCPECNLSCSPTHSDDLEEKANALLPTHAGDRLSPAGGAE